MDISTTRARESKDIKFVDDEPIGVCFLFEEGKLGFATVTDESRCLVVGATQRKNKAHLAD